MPTLAETWKECQVIFGGNKYTGYVNPDGAAMPRATQAQMAKAAEQNGDEVHHPEFVEVYIDGWGHRTLPAEWVYIAGKPVVGGVVAHPPAPEPAPAPPLVKRKVPPPPPVKRKQG